MIGPPLPSVKGASTHLVQTAENYDADTWLLMNHGVNPPRPAEFLARREAVVLGPWTHKLRRPLRAAGWRMAWADERTEAELWLRDAAPAGERSEQPARQGATPP